MKQIVKVALLVLLFSFKGVETNVYVCNSSKSVAYHETKDCRGLGRCTHEIIWVNKKEAINAYGKRACKICY